MNCLLVRLRSENHVAAPETMKSSGMPIWLATANNGVTTRKSVCELLISQGKPLNTIIACVTYTPAMTATRIQSR